MSVPVVLYRLRATVVVALSPNTQTALPFTRALFSGSGTDGSFPLLCASHKLNATQLQAQPYELRVEILFGRDRIGKYLLPVAPLPEIAPGPGAEDARRTAHKMMANEIMSYNFTNMLALLFPTNIPTMAGVFSSSPAMPLPPTPPWYGRRVNYSYIQWEGRTFTVTGTTWVNDARNNPRYAAILRECLVFDSWRTKLIDPENWAQTHDEFLKFERDFGAAIRDNKVSLESIRDGVTASASNKRTTDFSDAINGIIGYYAAQDAGTQGDVMVARAQLLTAMKTLRVVNSTIKEQTVRTETDMSIGYAIGKLRRFTNAYELVDKQEMAIQTIAQVNLRYADNPDMQAYLPEKYPPLVTFTAAIRAFQAKYVPGNIMWERAINTIVRSDTPSLVGTLLRLTGDPASSFNQVYFDEERVVDLSQGNADLPVRVADLQMNLIEGRITDDNKSVVSCAFADHRLGLSYARLAIDNSAKWKLPAPSYFSATALLAAAPPIAAPPTAVVPPAAKQGGRSHSRRTSVPGMRRTKRRN